MKSLKTFDRLANVVRVVEVVKVLNFGPRFTSIMFRDEYAAAAVPGQYLMVWLIGDDEIPLSISHAEKGSLCGITVKDVGKTTKQLCAIKAGESLGIRGPFGRGYLIRGKRPLLVAGGVGVAGIRLLTYTMIEREIAPTVVVGSRTASENIFHKEFVGLEGQGLLTYIPVTDDGSLGQQSLASQTVEKLVHERPFDQIYGCGPEKMLYALFQVALRERIGLQLSLERYIKCAAGICGQCVLDESGLLVCRDGPVFDKKELMASSDFGRFVRVASGKKIPI
ncbi:MAG: dihydroorotate dehydrogenase electron transfer subunit [Nitrososphaeria archaeon]